MQENKRLQICDINGEETLTIERHYLIAVMVR